MKGFLCLVLTCLALNVSAAPETCSIADEGDRINCGQYLSERECDERLCCYDGTAVNEKAICFHPMNACDLPRRACKRGATCQPIDAYLKNGQPVFSGEFECICPEGSPEGTDCRVRQGVCDNSHPEERTDCGPVGKFKDPPTHCANRGCCYDNSIKGVNWCFHPTPAKCPCGGMNRAELGP